MLAWIRVESAPCFQCNREPIKGNKILRTVQLVMKGMTPSFRSVLNEPIGIWMHWGTSVSGLGWEKVFFWLFPFKPASEHMLLFN